MRQTCNKPTGRFFTEQSLQDSTLSMLSDHTIRNALLYKNLGCLAEGLRDALCQLKCIVKCCTTVQKELE